MGLLLRFGAKLSDLAAEFHDVERPSGDVKPWDGEIFCPVLSRVRVRFPLLVLGLATFFQYFFCYGH